MLPWTRYLVDITRQYNILGLSVGLIFLTTFIAMLYLLVYHLKIKSIKWYCILAIFLFPCGWYIMHNLNIYEERIHFIQYGLLSILIAYSLQLKMTGWRLMLATFVLTSFFGWMDEIIQYYLPMRYFDWRDVRFNVAAGILGIILFVILKLAHNNSNKSILTNDTNSNNKNIRDVRDSHVA